MSKYKADDKVAVTVTGTDEVGHLTYYVLNDNFKLWEQVIDEYFEPLSTYTEPLEAKIRRQAAEITRLLAENKELKEDFKDIEPLDAKIERQAKVITRLLAINERLKAENKKMSAKIDAYELYGDQHEEEYNQAFNQGVEAAWELAKKIVIQDGYSAYDLYEIFGCSDLQYVLENYTYQEAAAKVAEWEKVNEIKVGDVVKIHEGNDNDLCVLCMSTDKKYYNAVDRYGAVYYMLTKEMFTKTGRHIDIDSFLKQIGEKE